MKICYLLKNDEQLLSQNGRVVSLTGRQRGTPKLNGRD